MHCPKPPSFVQKKSLKTFFVPKEPPKFYDLPSFKANLSSASVITEAYLDKAAGFPVGITSILYGDHVDPMGLKGLKGKTQLTSMIDDQSGTSYGSAGEESASDALSKKAYQKMAETYDFQSMLTKTIASEMDQQVLADLEGYLKAAEYAGKQTAKGSLDVLLPKPPPKKKGPKLTPKKSKK